MAVPIARLVMILPDTTTCSLETIAPSDSISASLEGLQQALTPIRIPSSARTEGAAHIAAIAFPKPANVMISLQRVSQALKLGVHGIPPGRMIISHSSKLNLSIVVSHLMIKSCDDLTYSSAFMETLVQGIPALYRIS